MKQYIVDTFSDKVFGGNPAAICICETWLDEETMTNITIENNLSETAFAVAKGSYYQLRWFTPGGEIDLCGHATLACGYVIMNYLDKSAQEVIFITLSGKLIVSRKGDLYEMDFPGYILSPISITTQIIEAIGVVPKEAYLARDMVCVFEDEKTIREMAPNMDKVKQLEGLLLHVTAPGKNADCVSRSFAPKLDVMEDPVCGSGHCHIAPYWFKSSNKTDIVAVQASKRGGVLYCSTHGDRVMLKGRAVLYAIADLYI